MKIITNTKYDGTLCFVQVKDFFYLAQVTGNKSLMNIYLSFINEGKSDNQFVKITNQHYMKAFEMCEEIIDFGYYVKNDIDSLTRLVVSMNVLFLQGEYDRKANQYKADGIRDVMFYKKKELDYNIPVVPSGEVEIESENAIFTASNLPDCFMFRSKNGKVFDMNLQQEFVSQCTIDVLSSKYPSLTNSDSNYKYIDNGNTLFLNVVGNRVVRKSKIGAILQRIRKEGK